MVMIVHELEHMMTKHFHLTMTIDLEMMAKKFFR